MRVKSHQILYAIIILTVVLCVIIALFPNNVIRIVIGLPFVLFFPGYVLLAALFPRKSSLNDIERLALDFGISLAVVPLIGLALNYTPWGITLDSILYTLAGFMFITSIVAWFRQWKLPDEENFSFQIRITWFSKRSLVEKILSVILVCVIVGLIGAVVYTVAVPKRNESYTEFYVLNAGGQASNYPEQLNLGDTGKVTLSITNHEQKEVSYRIDIQIEGVPTGNIGPVLLGNDEKYSTAATFTPRQSGAHQKVEFFLFKDDSLSPYLDLHIWVDVR